jgi:hypothetical protein
MGEEVGGRRRRGGENQIRLSKVAPVRLATEKTGSSFHPTPQCSGKARQVSRRPNGECYRTVIQFLTPGQLVDVAKTIIEQEQQERFEKWQKRMKGESGDYPPYVSDFSADLLEYVAVQSIENFGVHCYYAVSKQPLSSWYRTDRQLLPKGLVMVYSHVLLLLVNFSRQKYARSQCAAAYTDRDTIYARTDRKIARKT